MQIGAELDAFVRDRARQAHVAAHRRDAIEQWRASAAGQWAEAIVADAVEQRGAAALAVLRPLFDAPEWAGALIDALADALAQEAFYLPPLRDMRTAMVDGLALVDTPRGRNWSALRPAISRSVS